MQSLDEIAFCLGEAKPERRSLDDCASWIARSALATDTSRKLVPGHSVVAPEEQ